MRWLRPGVTVALVALAACVGTAGERTGGGDGRVAGDALPNAGIAYLAGSLPGGLLSEADVFLVDLDGGSARRLTTFRTGVGEPAWSPDGSSLVVPVGQRSTKPWNLFRVRIADGTSERLTTGMAFDQFPAWSPDGEHIAFTSDRSGNPNYEVFLLDLAGSAITRLTDDPGLDTEPAWSPDGRSIAFASSRSGLPGQDNWEIFTMAADGTGARRLTSDPWFDHDPAWAPDGGSIAFAARLESGTHAIMTMRPDGTGVRVVHSCRAPCVAIRGGPSWSPDGVSLAFALERAGPGGPVRRIAVVDAAGGRATELQTGPQEVCCPAWVGPPS